MSIAQSDHAAGIQVRDHAILWAPDAIGTGELQQSLAPMSPAHQVAEILADTANIGLACAALRSKGWPATIAGNRLSVNEEVFAQYVGVVDLHTTWMIHSAGGGQPIWVTCKD